MAVSIQQAALDWARSQVGVVEKPINLVPYWTRTWPQYQGGAWCGAFVTDAYRHAGFDLRQHVGAYNCDLIVEWARDIRAWRMDRATSAGFTLYGFGSRTTAHHVGLSWPDPDADGYRAIEGNTSPSSKGSQANGGQVAVRYRGRASILGWVDMDYVLGHYGVTSGGQILAPSAPTTGLLIADGIMDRGNRLAKELQERLRTFDPTIQVDGIVGPHTIRVLEEAMGTTQDGVLTGQNAYCRAKCPAMRADVFRLGGEGSRTVRRLQAYTEPKLQRDGLWGDGLNRALVHMMNAFPAFLTIADAGVIERRIREAGVQ